jgi:hypothetical protein
MSTVKTKKSKKVKIHNGFLYPLINCAMNSMRYICLVELFKVIGKNIAGGNNFLSVNYSRIAVDIFIVTKWLFLLLLWVFGVISKWATIAVWYLLATNLYTYFYYHTWSSEIFSDPYVNPDRIKRRFTNLVLAISYTVFGFGYLYNLPYAKEYSWHNGTPVFFQALWYSASTSLTASYDQVRPVTEVGNSISMIQLLMMFIFLTIIIGGSIPQTNQVNKEG